MEVESAMVGIFVATADSIVEQWNGFFILKISRLKYKTQVRLGKPIAWLKIQDLEIRIVTETEVWYYLQGSTLILANQFSPACLYSLVIQKSSGLWALSSFSFSRIEDILYYTTIIYDGSNTKSLLSCPHYMHTCIKPHPHLKETQLTNSWLVNLLVFGKQSVLSLNPKLCLEFCEQNGAA